MAAGFTVDPHRFVRSNTVASGVAAVEATEAPKSPTSTNRSANSSYLWEDDGSSEWRDSFSNWVCKRRNMNANLIANQRMDCRHEFDGASNSALFAMTPNVSFGAVANSTELCEQNLAVTQCAQYSNALNVVDGSIVSDRQLCSPLSSDTNDSADAPHNQVGLTAADERCISVREALKKYGTTPTPTSTPTHSKINRSESEVKSSRGLRTQVQVRTLSVLEKTRPGVMATAASCVPSKNGMLPLVSTPATNQSTTELEVDELTGLRRVSQFLSSVQRDRDSCTYSPACYSNEYWPAAAQRRNKDTVTSRQESKPEAETGDNDASCPVSADQTCAGCHKQLLTETAMYIERLKSVFHVHCFRCSICRDALVVQPPDTKVLTNLHPGTLKTVSVFIRGDRLLCGSCFEQDQLQPAASPFESSLL